LLRLPSLLQLPFLLVIPEGDLLFCSFHLEPLAVRDREVGHFHDKLCLMTTSIYVWIVGAGLLFVVLWFREQKRTIAIRAMAVRLGFVYLGRALPRSLTLNGTLLNRITSTWNVIDGERHGIRVIVFDCRIGTGKASWRRTMIAAQSNRDIFGSISSHVELTVERSGKWVFLYQPKTFSFVPHGLRAIPELEAHLSAIEP
jgi:hypothetical protein